MDSALQGMSQPMPVAADSVVAGRDLSESMNVVSKHRDLSAWMLIACGAWLVGLGLYFILLRPALLPEDTRFMGTTLAHIRNEVPGIESWLRNVFTVLGGFITGAGLLTIFVAAVAMPARWIGATWTIALSGVLTVGLMSAINFSIHSDFRWLLSVPALIWFAALVIHIARRRTTLAGTA